jgi:hypothetical protein
LQIARGARGLAAGEVLQPREVDLINNGLWMLPAHVGTSRSALATLQRDFARLRTLNHPHIAARLQW